MLTRAIIPLLVVCSGMLLVNDEASMHSHMHGPRDDSVPPFATISVLTRAPTSADGAVAALERDLTALKLQLSVSRTSREESHRALGGGEGGGTGGMGLKSKGNGTIESWPQARELYM